MNYLQFLIVFIIPNILGQYIENDHKINLEDIEDDNILNERLKHENDPLITQSTQHLRPPSILAINPYLTHQTSGGIIYATPATEGQIHYAQSVHDNQKLHHHHHSHHPHQLQYLTQQQSPELLAEQNYNQHVYGSPAAVHEHDPTYTYTTLASRQSLLKPIIPTTIATYLTQQQQTEPQQFIYYQQGRSLQPHQPQAIQQVVGGIQYITQQPPSPIIYTHGGGDQDSNEQQKITDDQIIYHHHHPQPQQIPGSGPTYLQYVPYISRGSTSEQSYIIMAPIPAGYSQPTPVPKPILSYTHSASPSHQQHLQYVHQEPPTPIVGGIQYVTNNEIENVPESVQPHPHPVQIPHAPDYTNAYPKRPSKVYRFETGDQSNTNYITSDYRETDNVKQQPNHKKDDNQSENIKIQSQNQHDEDRNHEDDFLPIKEVIPYTAKVQDIQYATPNSIIDEHKSYEDKSKQQEYAPQHPEKQQLPPTSKPSQNYQYFTSNEFSSSQSTTANPIRQRYYVTQKFSTGSTEHNQQQQHQERSNTQSWSHKVMPMQYQQQYESRYSTPSPISSTNTFAIKQGSSTAATSKPLRIKSNAFRSPIPKYYIPTPKTFQSTPRPTTTTFSITSNEQKHFTENQAKQQPQNYEIHSTPIPPATEIIQPIQQQQSPINNDQTNTEITNSQTFGNRQPKSLLESYIPSWVVVENQNNERRVQHGTDISNNNNNYNTISYSVQVQHNQVNGNHLKRSPTPTTIIPTKLFKV